MQRPVTSTSVATKGAELVAGSNPRRRRMNGSMAPATDPNITTPMRLSQTVTPMATGWPL